MNEREQSQIKVPEEAIGRGDNTVLSFIGSWITIGSALLGSTEAIKENPNAASIIIATAGIIAGIAINLRVASKANKAEEMLSKIHSVQNPKNESTS